MDTTDGSAQAAVSKTWNVLEEPHLRTSSDGERE